MQASMQVTEAAKGQPAFFRTNNGGYGTKWEAGRTDDPAEVPQYRELVSLIWLKLIGWKSVVQRNIWNGFWLFVKNSIYRERETWRWRILRGHTSTRLWERCVRMVRSTARFMGRSRVIWWLSRSRTLCLVPSHPRLKRSRSQNTHWTLATHCTLRLRCSMVECSQLPRTCQTSSSRGPKPSHQPSLADSSRTRDCTLLPPSLACQAIGTPEVYSEGSLSINLPLKFWNWWLCLLD